MEATTCHNVNFTSRQDRLPLHANQAHGRIAFDQIRQYGLKLQIKPKCQIQPAPRYLCARRETNQNPRATRFKTDMRPRIMIPCPTRTTMALLHSNAQTLAQQVCVSAQQLRVNVLPILSRDATRRACQAESPISAVLSVHCLLCRPCLAST